MFEGKPQFPDQEVATEKRHAAAMSDAAFKQGCLAVGLSPSEIARIMNTEADEPAKTTK